MGSLTPKWAGRLQEASLTFKAETFCVCKEDVKTNLGRERFIWFIHPNHSPLGQELKQKPGGILLARLLKLLSYTA